MVVCAAGSSGPSCGGKEVLYRDQDGWHLKMDVRCEAQTAACDEFVRHFEALNEPIYRMIEMQQEP